MPLQQAHKSASSTSLRMAHGRERHEVHTCVHAHTHTHSQTQATPVQHTPTQSHTLMHNGMTANKCVHTHTHKHSRSEKSCYVNGCGTFRFGSQHATPPTMWSSLCLHVIGKLLTSNEGILNTSTE